MDVIFFDIGFTIISLPIIGHYENLYQKCGIKELLTYIDLLKVLIMPVVRHKVYVQMVATHIDIFLFGPI
jgi:hypothetical protein